MRLFYRKLARGANPTGHELCSQRLHPWIHAEHDVDELLGCDRLQQFRHQVGTRDAATLGLDVENAGRRCRDPGDDGAASVAGRERQAPGARLAPEAAIALDSPPR